MSNYLWMKPQRAQRVAGFAVGGTGARRVHRHLHSSHALQSLTINIAFQRPNRAPRGGHLITAGWDFTWGTIHYDAVVSKTLDIHSVLRGQSSNGSGRQAALSITTFHTAAASYPIQHCSAVVRGRIQRGEERRGGISLLLHR